MSPAAKTRFNYPHMHSWDHFGVAHAVLCGDLLFISGIMAIDEEGILVGVGDVRAQATYVFRTLQKILEYHSASASDLVRTTTYFVGADDFDAVAQVRADFYPPGQRPASSSVRVAGLPRPDALIEVDAIAVISPPES